MLNIIMGIDPGIKGGVSFIDLKTQKLSVMDMPTIKVTRTKTKTYCDVEKLSIMVKDFGPNICYLEEVWSSPQMGVRSAFSFGDNFGSIKGVLAGKNVKTELVLPTIWKRDLECPKNKRGAVLQAHKLFPGCEGAVKKDGVAEASMVALWGCFDSGVKIPSKLEAENLTKRYKK